MPGPLQTPKARDQDEEQTALERRLDQAWVIVVAVLALAGALAVAQYVAAHLSWKDIVTALGLGVRPSRA